VIRLIASGALPVERTLTGEVPLADGLEAFEGLLDPQGDQVKIVLGV
jgi:threonine dehydrogenase-like Zn-dependent dehydrogenase